MDYFTVLILLVLAIRSLVNKVECSVEEARLVEYLFERQGYNPLIRPVPNPEMNITVDFGFAMIQLINLDEKNQIIKSNIWLRLTWKDYQLSWDPPDYGNIEVVRLPPEKVWMPDIVLFNNADGRFEVSFKSNVLIYSNGDLYWIPPSIYKSSCAIDVEFFPFDEQRCQLKFQSWTYTPSQLQLGFYEKKTRVSVNDYLHSGSWDLIDWPAEYNATTAQLTYTLVLRRKTLFYTINLIIPCILISLLNILVFYQPVEAWEKITMCISIMLAMVVFLLLVSRLLPPTSTNIPLFAKYLLFTFIMNIFTIVSTVIVINFHYRTPQTHQMSSVVRRVFFRILPTILFMKKPSQSDPSKSAEKLLQQSPRINQTVMDLTDFHHADCPLRNRMKKEQPQRANPTSTTQISPELNKAVEAIRFIAAHIKNQDDFNEVVDDWHYVSMVLDRIQLIVYLAVTIAGSIYIFTESPFIFSFINAYDLVAAEKETLNN